MTELVLGGPGCEGSVDTSWCCGGLWVQRSSVSLGVEDETEKGDHCWSP